MKKLYFLLLTILTLATSTNMLFASSDECVNAEIITPIANSTASMPGTFDGSTLSSSNTTCSITAIQDVWYQFTAISTKTRVRVTAALNGTDLGFTFYKGSCETAPIACVNNNSALMFLGDSEMRLYDDLEVGETYYIRAINFTSSNQVYGITVEVESITPPVNDLCANPTTLTSNIEFEGTQGTFANSGKEINAPNCYSTYYSQDVWYQFTAVESIATIEVKDLSIRSTIQLFNDACESTALACSSSNSNGSNSKLEATNLIPGNTYKFRVVNSSSTLITSNFNVGVTHIPTSPNNLIGEAITLIPGTSCTNIPASFASSTLEESAPDCATAASQDIWYTFTATQKMMRIVVGGESGLDHGFELYQSDLNNLITCVNEEGMILSEMYTSNEFEIGENYIIRVFNATSTPNSTPFNICVIEYPTPSNNDCTNATLIVPSLECEEVTGTFKGATTPTASCTTASQDVWYKFIATEPEMSISISGPNGLDQGFAVYKSSCEGQQLSCINDASMGSTENLELEDLEIGTNYYIQVLNTTTLNIGEFELCLIGSPTETCPAIVTISAPSTICENSEVIFTSSITNGGDAPIYQWTLNGTNVGLNNAELTLPSVSTNDIIELVILSNAECAPTNTMATSNTITIETIANVTPTFEVIDPVCFGTSITLPTISENEISGSWAPMFNNEETTNYTFTPAGNQCATSVDLTVEIIAISADVVVENKVIEVQSNGATYQWIDCATDTEISGATDATFAPSTPGSYKVKIQLESCEWTSTCYTVDNLSINKALNGLEISPNPFNHSFKIKGATIGTSFLVVNNLGMIVFEGTVENDSQIVTLPNLTEGLYHLQLKGQTFKLNKN